MNIFYDNVDSKLQEELNARGQAGMMSRTTDSLNFMLGKVANVQLTAYEGTGSASTMVPLNKFGVLGGATVAASRYLPTGPDGYLADRTVDRTQVAFYGDVGTLDDLEFQAKQSNLDQRNLIGRAYDKKLVLQDTSKRVGPYITNVDVTIGDHTMGLLNKATVAMIIPNAERDLDLVETTWFRPGRFVRIDIMHPESALASRETTQGLLSSSSVPNKTKLKELYPGWNIDELQNQIRRMNVFTFEGLITSFEFSYTGEGTVEASLSLTGTSNVYADISMYTSFGGKKTNTNSNINTDFAIGTAATKTEQEVTDIHGKKSKITVYTTASNQNEFVSQLYNQFNKNVDQYRSLNSITTPAAELQLLTAFTTDKINYSTDKFIMAGELYPTKKYTITVPVNSGTNTGPTGTGPQPFDTSSFLTQFGGEITTDITYVNDFLFGSPGAIAPVGALASQAIISVTSKAEYERYITLGGLIQFINDYAVTKYADPNNPTVGIICTDTLCQSNYYSYLTSCIPNEIMLLPADPSKSYDMNWHGDLGYYKDIISNQIKNGWEDPSLLEWPGVYAKLANNVDVIFPSRIFINLQTIESIVATLSAKNLRTFTLSQFLTAISNSISYATGGAISMKLITIPNDPSKLMFVDARYLKSADPHSTTHVKPYAIPMFANHPKGTIVRDFRFNATLPENAKNLSYVLNSGDDVSTDEIAPYMNFMYNSGNAAAVNRAIDGYKTKHLNIIDKLKTSREKNGAYPLVKANIAELFKSLADYIKIPTPDIRKSQQITAPIFPFTAEFTIDGINGFKYGDVLTFHALPERYKVNTVFSVISVTHTVSSQGEWTTNIKCIMRPSLD